MKNYLDNPKFQYELDTIARQYCNAPVFVDISEEMFSLLSEREQNLIHITMDDVIKHPDDIDLSTDVFDFLILQTKSDVAIAKGILFGERIDEAQEKFLHEKNLKNAYKRLLYKICSSSYDKRLDWGILSGIRPSKLYGETFKNAGDAQKANRNFAQSYLVNPQKIEVLEQIYFLQEKMLGDIDRNDFSIYVSVPFCPSKCNYCTFFSNEVAKKSALIEPYLQALEIELESILNSPWAKSRRADTLYIGGGTPSTLSASELIRFLKLLQNHIDFSALKEITFEAGRPDTIDREKLEVLKDFGIDRISINPQTMVDATLAKIGRGHTAQEIIDAFHLAREVGFDNINMDIILGLENENLSDLKYTLSELEKLSPDSITVHSLALKKASDLTKSISQNLAEQQYVRVSQMMNYIYESLKAEYLPYYLYRQKNILGGQENVGFAKKNKSSLYNMIIIEEYQNILSFGPGAVSRFVYPDENRIERCANTKNLEDYIGNIKQFISRKTQEMIL